jgi:hypothetical protein
MPSFLRASSLTALLVNTNLKYFSHHTPACRQQTAVAQLQVCARALEHMLRWPRCKYSHSYLSLLMLVLHEHWVFADVKKPYC